jgi:glycerol kinase
MQAQHSSFIGAIDQGTTGTRFMVFDHGGSPVASAYREHRQSYPQPGWVEHDPEEIWANTQAVMAEALSQVPGGLRGLAAIGVTNQRETSLLWDADTGRPLHPAIVWQDRRTASRCAEIRALGLAEAIRQRTGLPVDPYFSATKIEWLLRHLPDGVRARDIRFGTMDTWLIWQLTGAHVTDPTNASRTLLYNIDRLDWDEELLRLFGVPREILPVVASSSEVYGRLRPDHCEVLCRALGSGAKLPEVPVCADLGDQQAALFGQAGFSPGETKNTYGTGSFLLHNTGTVRSQPRAGLLSTIAYALPRRPVCYALEGSIFVTGAAVQWLRDGLGVITAAAETEALALAVPDCGGVYFVPALTGLGAPYWNPHARGTLVGLTRGTGVPHLARATLEAIAYQTRDVVEAMIAVPSRSAPALTLPALKVDGGAVANRFLCQFQADILGVPVLRPRVAETTSLGAAYAAGLAVGYWRDLEEIGRLWLPEHTFEPGLSAARREELYAGWQRAVRCALQWAGAESGASPAADATSAPSAGA